MSNFCEGGARFPLAGACSHLLSLAPYASPCHAGTPWHSSRCPSPRERLSTSGRGAESCCSRLQPRDRCAHADDCVSLALRELGREFARGPRICCALAVESMGLVALEGHQKMLLVVRARDFLIMASGIKGVHSSHLPYFCRSLPCRALSPRAFNHFPSSQMRCTRCAGHGAAVVPRDTFGVQLAQRFPLQASRGAHGAFVAYAGSGVSTIS